MDNATLTRFFSFHSILLLVAAAFSLIHIMFLHLSGANNKPLGISSQLDKVPFHPYFTFKDIVGFVAITTILLFLTLLALTS